MARNQEFSNKKKLIFLLVSTVLVIIFANVIPKISVYIKQPEAASLLNFPQDHVSHPNFKAEWWYLNLLAKTVKSDGAEEKDLAYVISFSRIKRNGIDYKGLLSSRYEQSTKSFKESTNTGGDLTVYLTDNKYLFVQYSNGPNYATLQEKPPGADRKRKYKLTGKTDQIGTFNLTLKERTLSSSPLLWGGTTGNCTGQISVFAPSDTFYYSIPDLDIIGTITDIDGVNRNVRAGKAWIDHQWFNFKDPLPSDWKGHYWTSFSFTESNDLYNSEPHQAVGFVTQIYQSGPKYTYWVKRGSDGTNKCGDSGKITINNWGSTNYPSSWKIELNKSGVSFLEATGNSFSDNQIIKTPFGLLMESASYYSGKRNGENFTGLGFFETHRTKPQ